MIPSSESKPLTVAIRQQLAAYCRNKRLRSAEFKNDRPIDWQPGNVIDPDTNCGFTEGKAWNFIADLLDANHDVEIVELKMPPGKLGYVMKKEMPDGRTVYIKLQLANTVIGRSFHYSYRE